MILGIYGYPNSGKTAMVEALTRALVKDGFTVASIKHSAHADLADTKGKDSWRHAEAGSNPVALTTANGTVVRVQGPLSIEVLVHMLEDSFSPDAIIIEGLKEGPYPKVSMGDIKPRKGTVLSNPTRAQLVKYVKREIAVEKTLASLPGLDCNKCGLDCISLARAIVDGKKTDADCRELPSRDVSITVGAKRIATGTFVSEIVDDTIRGMLGSLKGYEPGKDVEIRLKANNKGSRKRPS